MRTFRHTGRAALVLSLLCEALPGVSPAMIQETVTPNIDPICNSPSLDNIVGIPASQVRSSSKLYNAYRAGAVP